MSAALTELRASPGWKPLRPFRLPDQASARRFPPFALQALRGVLWQDVFPQVRLWEFFQVDVAGAVEEFRAHLQNGAYAAKTLPPSA